LEGLIVAGEEITKNEDRDVKYGDNFEEMRKEVQSELADKPEVEDKPKFVSYYYF
jgi:hypothetical protein